MPNTVFGPYIATVWQQNVTAANATNMNHLENGPIYALHGYNSDLLSPYVDHGIVASRDGAILNQLNVTAGHAYVTVIDSSGLSSLALIATTSSTASQFLTATPSTTYYLFLLKDGTWQWGTTSTGPTNSLAICSATTDGSGNINVVTDTRPLLTKLQPNAEVVSAPYVVARLINDHITTTSAGTNILTYAPPVTGVYRVSATVYMNNTSDQLVTFAVSWSDASTGATASRNMFDAARTWDGATTIPHNRVYAFMPITAYVQTGGALPLTVSYGDPGGVPSDYVTILVERIA